MQEKQKYAHECIINDEFHFVFSIFEKSEKHAAILIRWLHNEAQYEATKQPHKIKHIPYIAQ